MNDLPDQKSLSVVSKSVETQTHMLGEKKENRPRPSDARGPSGIASYRETPGGSTFRIDFREEG